MVSQCFGFSFARQNQPAMKIDREAARAAAKRETNERFRAITMEVEAAERKKRSVKVGGFEVGDILEQ